MTGRRAAGLAIGIFFATVVCPILAALGILPQVGAEIPYLLLTGWATYLNHVAREVDIDWPNVGLAGVCGVLLAVGFHYFCSWLQREAAKKKTEGGDVKLAVDTTGVGRAAAPRTWKVRTSLSILALVLLAFVAGIAAVGAVHQVAWMGPVTKSYGYATSTPIETGKSSPARP